MNKAELMQALRKETGLSRSKAKEVVDLFFDEMTEGLAKGDRVEIRGFCSIFVKNYKGYTGRNPKTGELVQIKPKKLPFFKCGKELKERVDNEQTGGKKKFDGKHFTARETRLLEQVAFVFKQADADQMKEASHLHGTEGIQWRSSRNWGNSQAESE